MSTPTLTFTVAEIVAQRYTVEHAEAFVALLAMRPPASQRRQARAATQSEKTVADRPPKGRAAGATKRGTPAARTITRADFPAIRQWAAEAGLKCSAKGRIPDAVLDGWRAR